MSIHCRYILLGPVVFLALLPARAGAAATTPLAAPLYPAHTQLIERATVSNSQMDCEWGFACQNGEPLIQRPVFHFTTEDDLQRVSGWAQFGRVRSHGKEMLFALYASRYVDGQDAEGLPWSLRAFVDFRLATLAHGFAELNHDPALVPKGVLGNSGGQIVLSSGRDILALSCWAGSIDVEAVAIYTHGDRRARSIALRDLTGQVRLAMRQGSQSAGS